MFINFVQAFHGEVKSNTKFSSLCNQHTDLSLDDAIKRCWHFAKQEQTTLPVLNIFFKSFLRFPKHVNFDLQY